MESFVFGSFLGVFRGWRLVVIIGFELGDVWWGGLGFGFYRCFSFFSLFLGREFVGYLIRRRVLVLVLRC